MTIRPAVLVSTLIVGVCIGFVMWRDWLDGVTMLAIAIALWAALRAPARENISAK